MRRLVVSLGLVACFLVVFFHHGLGWNPSSRLLTVYALVDDHELAADDFKKETGDYAEVNHHIYSDKAPLSSFMVLPFYWVIRYAEVGAQTERDREMGNHIGVLVASAFPFVAFALLMLVRSLREDDNAKRVVWLTMAGAFGTCLANYGGTFFGHMLAAALVLGGYVLACEREEHFAIAGALGGLSVLAEYPVAVTQMLIFGYLLLGPQRWRRAFLYGAGAFPMALLMLAYNKLITGKWLDFPYSHVPEMWHEMHKAFGIRLPDPSAMWELLFGQYRGLAFYAAPLLLLVPLLITSFAGPRRRQLLVLTLMGGNLLLIGSYFKWDGGWCLGPRHLAPLMTLGMYEGVAALARVKRFRGLFYVLCAWSGLVSIMGSATDSMPGEGFHSPAFEVFFPKFWKGELSDHILFSDRHLLGDWALPNGRYLIFVWLALFGISSWLLARYAAKATAPAAPLPAPVPMPIDVTPQAPALQPEPPTPSA